MKLILLTLSFLLAFACNTTKETSKMMGQKDLELVKAYKQKWYGGRPNVKGTYYKVVLNQKSDTEIVFDSMYVENKWHKAFLEDKNPYVIMASITDPMPIDNILLDPTQEQPKEKETIVEEDQDETFKDKNVLMYQINGKKAYFEIGEFTNEKAKMYP